jgi:hypothetical protein
MRRSIVGILCLGLMAAGCGGPASNPLTKEGEGALALNDVGELYRVYTAQNKKPPTKLTDLVPMEPMSPMGMRAIESGDVIVRFGATMTETEEGPARTSSDEVLAFQKDVPNTGGQVLMLDRTVRSMSPEEFKAAKLAGTSSSEVVAAKGKAKSR